MTEEEMNLSDVLEQTKNSLIISEAFTKADSILNHKEYKNIACSVSGGAVRMSKNRFAYYINKEKFMNYEIAEDASANW